LFILGCGAFRGDIFLKSIIQWLAASINKREIEYYTLQKEPFTQRFIEITKALREKNISVGTLYKEITKFENEKFEYFPNVFKLLWERLNLGK
jgi:poly(ADP-ribose) glycohydrolase